MTERWLSIVGIGEDGLDGLSPAASRLLAQARFIIGGSRHLAMLGECKAETRVWSSPIEQSILDIKARRGSSVCVLASGDPFLFGIGSVLAAEISPQEMICLPSSSSLSLAAARLGWALQDCDIVSLHGRPFERIIPHLRPRARLLILSWDHQTPEALARLLAERGLGASRMITMQALGGPREAVIESTADSFAAPSIDPLNLVAIEIAAPDFHRCIPLTPGLPDEWFESDGQITKREIRALTLSALAPWPGARLWDVGAGSGSVAIEWMLSHPRNRAWAVEARDDRAQRILRNAASLGVPDLAVVVGEAKMQMTALPPPDAIFVGGGGCDVIDEAWRLLPGGRRIVVNAVTLETQNAIADRQARLGGSLISVSIAYADTVGSYRSWHPARPLIQWRAVKP